MASTFSLHPHHLRHPCSFLSFVSLCVLRVFVVNDSFEIETFYLITLYQNIWIDLNVYAYNYTNPFLHPSTAHMSIAPEYYFFVALFGLTTFALVIAVIYYRFIKLKHTRERFAFFALRIVAGFILTSSGILIAQHPLFNWFIRLVNNYLLIDSSQAIPPYQAPDWEIIALHMLFILGSTFLLFQLIKTLYINWDGAKSVRQASLEQTKSKVKLTAESRFYQQKRSSQQPIERYQAPPTTQRTIFGEEQPDQRAWHIKAVELLRLYDTQYDIDPTNDWHRDYQTYISNYGEEGKKISVLCVEEPPIVANKAAYIQLVRDYVNFVNKQQHDFERHLIVVANGQVTKNAYDKTDLLPLLPPQLQSLHFDLKIAYRYENELLDKLINLKKYKRTITKDFEEKTLANTHLTLADMYVPLSGEERHIVQQKLAKVPDGDIDNVEQFILNWVKSEKGNTREHIAILGQYGQGKTVLATKLVKEILAAPDTYQRIPILLNLRGLSPRNMDMEALFAQWCNRFRGEVQALVELNQAGKLLIILDGFDEMDLVGDTEILFNHFAQLWTFANTPKSKIIILGRPNLFADDVERRDALGIIAPQVYGVYTKAIYLHPLSQMQIEQALRHVSKKTKQGILTTLQQVGQASSFAELIARPSTLYQLSTVWDRELAKQKDRLNSATVIGSFIDKSYDRQDSKDGKQQVGVLTTLERNYFMMGIAVGMMRQNQYTNQIKHSQLMELVRQLWEHYPEQLPPYELATKAKKGKQGNLKQRLKENLDPLQTILRDVRVGGILVEEVSGRDIFKFAHKSYLEYLVSAFYAHFLLQKQEDKIALMKANSIAQALHFKQTELAPSKDVERFTAEHIVANMELMNKDGNPMPQKDNEEQYRKAIYRKVIPHWHRRLFPNVMGWMTLHPAQKWLLGIIVCSLISLIFMLTTDNENMQVGLGWFNVLLYASIFGVILYYDLHLHNVKKEKSIAKVFIPDCKYGVYIRLYVEACLLLNQKPQEIRDSYYRMMMCSSKQKIYRTIVMSGLNIFIFVSAAVALAEVILVIGIRTIVGAGVGVAVAILTVLTLVRVVGGATLAIGVVAGIVTGVVIGVVVIAEAEVEVAIGVAVVVAGAVAVTGVEIGAGIGAGIVTGIVTGAGLLAGILAGARVGILAGVWAEVGAGAGAGILIVTIFLFPLIIDFQNSLKKLESIELPYSS